MIAFFAFAPELRTILYTSLYTNNAIESLNPQVRKKEASFPAVKSLDSFEFAALPSFNKTLVLELARSEYVARRENIIAVGNSGTGKTHVALGPGLAACQKGLVVGFTATAAALVNELREARDEKRLLHLQRQLAGYKLLIVDELGISRYHDHLRHCLQAYFASPVVHSALYQSTISLPKETDQSCGSA
jgi:DNA replication protein DnaC